MSAKYKLRYFSVKVIGEPIRFLLAYGNIPYEDIRINFSSEWSEIKDTKVAPFGLLPTLEVDGKIINQHIAICRFVARKVNLMGKSDLENAEIDAIVETMNDYRSAFFPLKHIEDPAEKAQKWDDFKKTTLPYYLEKFESIVQENGGYFVGKQMTWADVYFVGCTDLLELMTSTEDPLSKYPNLKALSDKISSIPQIKKWIDTRPADKR